jgi:hypothetical protein
MTRDGFETLSERSERETRFRLSERSERRERSERCWTTRPRIQVQEDLASFEAEMLKSPDTPLAGVCG